MFSSFDLVSIGYILPNADFYFKEWGNYKDVLMLVHYQTGTREVLDTKSMLQYAIETSVNFLPMQYFGE